MKECFKCHQVLPLGDFYKHKQMRDGHLNKCKKCARKDAAENRLKRIEYYRAYDRGRGSRQPPSYIKEYRKNHPKKYAATNMVNNAIRGGKLFREPCEECGENKTHAHHDDYAKPLNIRWLCTACHNAWHRENGEGLNG